MNSDSFTVSRAEWNALQLQLLQLEQRSRGLPVSATMPQQHKVDTSPRVIDPAVQIFLFASQWGAHDWRLIRQAIEAVCVAAGLPSPSDTIPTELVRACESVYTARKSGSTWQDALEESGLDLPTPEDISRLALEASTHSAQLLEDSLHVADVVPGTLRNSFAGDMLKSALAAVLG